MRDPDIAIFYTDIEALDLLLEPILLTLEFETVSNWVRGGFPLLDMELPERSFGLTNDRHFYVGASQNIYSITDLNFIYTYVTTHYIFFDGDTVFLAKTIVSTEASATEEQQLASIVDSVRSSAASSPFGDSDEDGIMNYLEQIFYGSNPFDRDSNSDGIDDGTMLDLGLSPLFELDPIVGLIKENPASFGLYDEESIVDLRMDGLMVEASPNGNISFQYRIEQSNDLASWTLHSNPAVVVTPNDPRKAFLRIRVER